MAVLNILCSSSIFLENRQLEVFVAVAVGGVLTILTLSLIIIYVLISRDSFCLSLKHHSQRSDQSEMGRYRD